MMHFKKQIEADREAIIRDTRELIRIRSVREEGGAGAPFGKGMNEALEYVLDKARGMGFSVRNLDGYCGYAEYGQGDLYIGVLTHVDTCPPGEMWGVPPFEAVIRNNRIYGRGAMDNKGPLIAALYGLKAVKDSGRKMNKKIRFFVGTDEERYYQDISHYLAHEAPPIAGFTLDGQFPVVFAEKGLAMMEYRRKFRNAGEETLVRLRGGTSENTVPGHCEALLRTRRKSEIVSAVSLFAKENRHNMTARILEEGVLIESFGMEAHSMSIETGRNAIVPMIRFLRQLSFGSADVRQILAYLDRVFGPDFYGTEMGIACGDAFSGKLTVNLGVVRLEESEAAVRIDLRYPVTCDFRSVSRRIRGSFESCGFEEEENTYWDPVYFPKEHFLIKVLQKAYRSVTRDDSEPIASGSGSYSKVMPNIAAFGALFPGESQDWHRINEYVEIDNLLKMAEIYACAIYELGTTL